MSNLFVTGDDGGDTGVTFIGDSTGGVTGGGIPNGTSDEYIQAVKDKIDASLEDYYDFNQADTTSAVKTNIHIANHKVAWDYDLNDKLFHSVFTLSDIITIDIDSLVNPYSKQVIVSDGYAVDPTYGNNPAYTEFEKLKIEAKDIQTEAIKSEEERIAQAEADNKEFQDKLDQIKENKESNKWEFDFPEWVTAPQPMELTYLTPILQDPTQNLILNTTGKMNRWMAGGDLYDAPRAGDVLFNVSGNLNTVRFLGLQDTNSTPDLVQRFVSPNVSSMFGPMAGDENFSVL